MLSAEERSEIARHASRVRWAASPIEDRAAHARAAANARWAGHQRKPPRRTREVRACRYCGESVPMQLTQIQCGATDCRLARNAERMRTEYAGAVRAAKHRRRARLAGADIVESFNDLEIFVRDDWCCRICGDPVDRALPSRHPMSVSLDHIRPISAGGNHTRTNVQTAHLVCNERKGRAFTAA